MFAFQPLCSPVGGPGREELFGISGAPGPIHVGRVPSRGAPVLSQGCSKVGPGHAKPETRRPKKGEEGNIEHRTSNIQHPIPERQPPPPLDVGCSMLDVEILRSSDFRAAEHDLPSTGRTLEQPCCFPPRQIFGWQCDCGVCILR